MDLSIATPELFRNRLQSARASQITGRAKSSRTQTARPSIAGLAVVAIGVGRPLAARIWKAWICSMNCLGISLRSSVVPIAKRSCAGKYSAHVPLDPIMYQTGPSAVGKTIIPDA